MNIYKQVPGMIQKRRILKQAPIPVQPLAPAGGMMPAAPVKPMPMVSRVVPAPSGPVSLDNERYSNRPSITKFRNPGSLF